MLNSTEHIISTAHKSKKEGKVQELTQSIPHLTQDTTWESDINMIKHHIKETVLLSMLSIKLITSTVASGAYL